MKVPPSIQELCRRVGRWLAAKRRHGLAQEEKRRSPAGGMKHWLNMDVGELGRQFQKRLYRSWTREWSAGGQLRNVAEWSPAMRWVVLGTSFVVIFGCAAWLLWSDLLRRLDAQAHETEVLKIRYVQLAAQSMMTPQYEQQINEIEAQFGSLLEMIPASLESVQVLHQISQAARDSGLRLQWFKPAPEMPEDAYVILPVDIRLVGNYHAVGRFLDAVSRMKHLITVDVILEGADAAPGQLVLATQIKAYRGGDGARLPVTKQIREEASRAAR